MNRKLIISVFTILILNFSNLLICQENLFDVDTSRLYQVPLNIVKNAELKVISDIEFKNAGLTLTKIGFRKNPHRRPELLVQFRCDTLTNLDLDIRFQLFDNDGNSYWNNTYKKINQPGEYQLVTLFSDLNDVELKMGSKLYMWVASPIKYLPYEMWEWLDYSYSKWIEPMPNK